MKQLKVISVLLVCLLAAITTGLRAQPLQEQEKVTPPVWTAAPPTIASVWANPLQEARTGQRADASGEDLLIGKPLATGVCPGEGNCFQANGTPGCDESTCCEAVCALNPFCCEVEWDARCAAEAAEICGNCGDAAAGNCFEDNGTPGCSNFDCCATVCAVDDFCCFTQWDQQCADEAAKICGDLIWFTNQAAFEAFNAGKGKVLKGIEDYEESILDPDELAGMDDPLISGVPNWPIGFPFQDGMTGLPNLIVQSNVSAGNPSAPHPHGVNALLAVSDGRFGAVSDVVVPNFAADSLDLIFTDEKSGVGFNTISFFGSQVVEVRVYGRTNEFLGMMTIPSDEVGTNFIGVFSPDPIGRINIFDPGSESEGADNIQAWGAAPCPADLDGDGNVGASDLLELLFNWGPCQ